MSPKRQANPFRRAELRDDNVTIAKQISEQFNRMLTAKMGQAELLKHNLEKGLGNEESLRELLSDFLPGRYGVAKGKVANAQGTMSRQLDVIIYDAVNCPILFIDEHRNQILPIEGVFGVIEVKTSLSATALADAFQNLGSVCGLAPRVNRSLNDFVTACPPYLKVFAFRDARPLSKVAMQFAKLSRANQVAENCYSYSEKSPGFKRCTGDRYLVCSVDILGKGSIHHMLDGTIDVDDFGEYTLGMFLFELLSDFADIQMPAIEIRDYLNWIKVASWRGPSNSLMVRQGIVDCVHRALVSVHGDVDASGSFPREGASFEMRIEATIDGAEREYKIAIPRDLSPDEIEQLAVSQIHDADASIAKRAKPLEPGAKSNGTNVAN